MNVSGREMTAMSNECLRNRRRECRHQDRNHPEYDTDLLEYSASHEAVNA